MSDLPVATIVRIAKNNTGVVRVGEGAAKLLVTEATEYIKQIATAAGKVASHAGRATIREDDITFVLENNAW